MMLAAEILVAQPIGGAGFGVEALRVAFRALSERHGSDLAELRIAPEHWEDYADTLLEMVSAESRAYWNVMRDSRGLDLQFCGVSLKADSTVPPMTLRGVYPFVAR